MFIPIYQGQIYSFSYEVETGHYLLFSNDYKAHTYLQGDDSRIFREQIEHIDSLPKLQCNIEKLTENTISIYL